MALHGSIKVNHIPIGHWSARRVNKVVGDGPNRYECEVYTSSDNTTRKFDVFHTYADGAVALAAKVLLKAVGREEDPE